MGRVGIAQCPARSGTGRHVTNAQARKERGGRSGPPVRKGATLRGSEEAKESFTPGVSNETTSEGNAAAVQQDAQALQVFFDVLWSAWEIDACS
jgi:hypothetical protein